MLELCTLYIHVYKCGLLRLTFLIHNVNVKKKSNIRNKCIETIIEKSCNQSINALLLPNSFIEEIVISLYTVQCTVSLKGIELQQFIYIKHSFKNCFQ